MNTYDFVALIILPLVIIHFSIDYLSDSQITHNETKIGVLGIFHHLVLTIQMVSIIFAIIPGTAPVGIIILGIIISIIVQAGYLINNDYCWVTRMVNELIDSQKPNRKWLCDIILQIKKYVRGDEWAYSDIRNVDQTGIVILSNLSFIIVLIKIILILNGICKIKMY